METLVFGSSEPNFVFKLKYVEPSKSMNHCNVNVNRIYNKIVDWFSARLFVIGARSRWCQITGFEFQLFVIDQ